MNILELSYWYSNWPFEEQVFISRALREENILDAADAFDTYAKTYLFNTNTFLRLDLASIDILYKFAFLCQADVGRIGEERTEQAVAKYVNMFGTHPFEDRAVTRLYWETDPNGRYTYFRREGLLPPSVHQADMMRMHWKLAQSGAILMPEPDYDTPLTEYHLPCKFFRAQPEGWERVEVVDRNTGPFFKAPIGAPICDEYLLPQHWSDASVATGKPVQNALMIFHCGQGDGKGA